MNKKEMAIGLIFFSIGIIFLIIGFFLENLTKEVERDWIKTTAVILDIQYRGNDEYDVWIQYEVEGEERETKLGSYHSNMYIGEEIMIWYDPENPSKTYVDFQKYGSWIALGMGALFAGIGGIIIGSKLKKKKKNQWLEANGEQIEAEINEIQMNRGYRVNGIHPYVIICRWKDPSTGVYYMFKSDNIWFNPQRIIEESYLKTLTVYLDRNNYKKYYVSLEPLQVKNLY